MIYIYTDGASKGNPGKGGYGIVFLYRHWRKEISAGYRSTTNNRMELLASIVGLETIKYKNIPITLYTDSRYIVDAIEKKWLLKWIASNFKGKKNVDLWKRFWLIYQKHQVNVRWIKGHAGNKENERCDFLAKESIKKKLLIDHYYELCTKFNK